MFYMLKKGILTTGMCLSILGLAGCQHNNSSNTDIESLNSIQQELSEQEAIYNNGGNFVKIDDAIYYIKIPENAFERTALYGEYRSETIAGEECVLMCYEPEKKEAPQEIATVIGNSKIAYYDSCFYVSGIGESGVEEIWEIEKETGQKSLIVNAELKDIDENTGRFVALKELDGERIIIVYEGKKQACLLTLPSNTDTYLEEAYVRGDYLIYWDLYYPYGEDGEDWGSLYAYHIPSGETKCLGQIPISDMGYEAFFPEMDQIEVMGDTIYFTIGYYGGTGHFVNDSSIFQANLLEENSIQFIRGESDYEEYNQYIGTYHVNSLPEIVMSPYQDQEIYFDYDTATLQWMKPVKGAMPEKVTLLQRPEFSYESSDYQIVEVAEYVDGKVYCIINHVVENPDESIGWRSAYTVNQVEYCEINVANKELYQLDVQDFPTWKPIETIYIDCPTLDSISTVTSSDDLFAKPITLTKVSEEENDIIDTEQWLYEHGFEDEIAGNTPGYSFQIRDEYDIITRSGYILEILDSDTNQIAYKVDLAGFRDPLTYEIDENYMDYLQVDYRFAYLENDILYVSMAHRTYAESMPYTAFIIAIDLKNQTLLWKSKNLVSNALSFVVVDDVIICGYGFTEEEDFLYQLDKNNGSIIGTPISLKTGPDYIFLKNGQLFVRTYHENYVFSIDK